MMRKHTPAITAWVALIVIYSVQLLIIPPDAVALSKYHLTAASARLITLTFLVPLMAVWVTALFAYLRLDSYAHTIKQAADGRALATLAQGLLALALYMPFNSVVQNGASYLRHHDPSLTKGMVIITNYSNIIVMLAVAYLVWQGSRKLLSAMKTSPKSINRRYLYAGTAIVAGILSYLVLWNPGKTIPGSGGFAAYYLPDWLLVTTILVPYVIVWYLGMAAVQNIMVYRARIKGIIYQSALGYIANGIAFTIISLLVLRSLSAQINWFDTITLKYILMILYALVFMIGIGYGLVWLGTKKLQLIEKV